MAVLAVPARPSESGPVSRSEPRDIPALTGLRGVAAVYVVVFHYFGLSFSGPLETFFAHGYLAVDLFFILSGFVMALNYRHLFSRTFTRANYGRFLGRRLARVYPLYLAATIAAYLLISAGLLFYGHARPTTIIFALNAAMVQTWGFVASLDGPGWSISAEWAAYLIFPLLLIPTLSRRPAWGWLTAGVCIGVIFILSALPAAVVPGRSHPAALLDIHAPEFGLPVVRALAEFLLGLLAFRLAGSPFGMAIAASRWIAPFVCIVLLVLMMVARTDVLVVALFPFLIVTAASQTHVPGRFLASRPAQFLGVLSYGVYLLHDLLGGLLDSVHALANRAGFAHGQTIAAGVCIVVTFVLAYGAYHAIEAPGRRWLRSLLEPERGASMDSAHDALTSR